MQIKGILSNRISKATVDILLLIGFVLTLISSRSAESSWWSFHCIVSMIWYFNDYPYLAALGNDKSGV
jgi:hypothetical protein